jgi:hypothetical protein
MKIGHSMRINSFYHLCVWLFLSLPASIFAETAYVTDKLMAGIHQNNTTDSVIIKVIPTGTQLEILKQEGKLTQIKDPEGVTGWINNRFLVNTPPAPSLLNQAEERANKLENELEIARSKIKELVTGNPAQNTGGAPEALALLKKENTELKQQSKSAQLKVGELQANLAELRNQMSQVSSDAAMAKKIDQLNKEKSTLEKQLDAMQSDSESNTNNTTMQANTNKISWSNVLISFCITLIVGVAIGAYLLDLANRRRHGGFRI